MANMVGGLFPELAGALAANPLADAYKPISDPMAAYTGLIGGAGAELRQSVGQAFGQQTPQEQLRSIVQAVQQRADLTTPEGLIELANQLNANPQFSGFALNIRQQAAKLAAEGRKENLETELTQTRIAGEKARIKESEERATKLGQEINREEQLRKALADLPDNPTEQQLLSVYRRFGSADAQARAIQASLDRKNALAAKQAADAGPTAGYIGKSGAYRNQFGDVISATEMKKQRDNFEASQDLLARLNKIDAKDIKESKALFDYTTSDISKSVAGTLSEKTLQAQTRIAASQLLEQINKLPPGSASDADIRLAAKNFPGYSNPEALARWVNDTKELLQGSMERQIELYGFRPRVKSTGRIELKPQTQAGQPAATQAAPMAPGRPRATKRWDEATQSLVDVQ